MSHGSTTEGSVRYRLSRALETYVLKHANHIVTICAGLKRDAIARGVSEERISVVPNAVDREMLGASSISEVNSELLANLEGRKVFGFFGSFYQYEGLDELLDAVAEVKRDHPLVSVLLLGSGPEENALKRQTKALELEDHVIFAGRVPHQDVPALYRNIDVFVFPRKPMRLTELVTPLKPLEAMVAGALVLASDVGGHKELIDEGRTGLLYRAGSVPALVDLMNRVLDSAPGSYDGIREKAREFVLNERTWPAVARLYPPIYESAAADSSQR